MADLVTFLTSEALKPLLKELLKIYRKRREEIDVISEVFGDPLELARFYIEPFCQHQNPADFNEEEPISLVRSKVFSTMNDFFNREFPGRSEGRNTMFILSDAGMGKTSLLVMIKLLHLSRFWPKQFTCKLLKLGNDSLDEIEQITFKARTILLLDSLDEDPLSWDDTERRLLDILNATSKFRRVVITCRTQYFPKTASDPFNRPGRVELAGYVSPMMFLSYFDEHQVDQYLFKRLPKTLKQRLMGRPNNRIIKAESLLRKIKSLQFRPLLLAHIEDLLASNEPIWDEYGLYNALVRAWLLREERKLREQSHELSTDQLLDACTEVALLMQMSRQRTISREQLQELILKSPNVSFLSKLNFGGRALLNRNSAGDYRFSHYSIQEFLLAAFVLNNPYRDKAYRFSVTDQMLNFILARVENARHVVRVVPFGGSHQFDPYTYVCLYCGMTYPYAKHTQQLTCASTRSVASFSFSGLRFDDLNLSGKELSGHVFSSCSFAGADLTGVNLAGCDLRDTVFDRANLTNANLEGAILTGTSFTNAIVDHVRSDKPITSPTLEH